jgi:hypothetical protein
MLWAILLGHRGRAEADAPPGRGPLIRPIVDGKRRGTAALWLPQRPLIRTTESDVGR